jgi:hypothetical protein
MGSLPTQLLLTVDTEVYPLSSNWQQDMLEPDIDRDIYGKTPFGHFGLVYQLDTFRKHGIKAVFFVESLFASCPRVGIEPLRRIVDLIRSYEQDVQLHLHPEWLPHLPNFPVEFRGNLIRHYSEDEQCHLLEMATENLVRAGAEPVVAFRAGDYGANEDTLRALARLGFQFDCSFNLPYSTSSCALSGIGATWHAKRTHGIWEVPISCFEDWPGHYRHCQLGACSAAELIRALNSAMAQGWNTFSIVSHSFEMLANRRSSQPIASRPSVIRRFQNLCRMIASRSDVATAHFADLSLTDIEVQSIQGSVINTGLRFAEQIASRMRARWPQR